MKFLEYFVTSINLIVAAMAIGLFVLYDLSTVEWGWKVFIFLVFTALAVGYLAWIKSIRR